MDLLIVCECDSDLSTSLKLCSLLRHFFFPNMVVCLCIYTTITGMDLLIVCEFPGDLSHILDAKCAS
ncbi:hypothetical protein OIU74_000881 [Salix koriyanagi]|uniref:Uncharacterized protein n=1 Tax=Salix koriyanagi TaxID=2511006 RepID=A0A9Q0X1L0_9ROSI|nr:hypothetical protein OIU74_000881 [Salix koriyanagi]